MRVKSVLICLDQMVVEEMAALVVFDKQRWVGLRAAQLGIFLFKVMNADPFVGNTFLEKLPCS